MKEDPTDRKLFIEGLKEIAKEMSNGKYPFALTDYEKSQFLREKFTDEIAKLSNFTLGRI